MPADAQAEARGVVGSLMPQVENLHELFRVLVRAREKRGAIEFESGEEFDSSWNRGTPLDFPLGAGRVIAGWDTGIAGMKVGGRRKLTIPAHLAYGDRGAGGVIKPGECLIFVVDLVDVH